MKMFDWLTGKKKKIGVELKKTSKTQPLLKESDLKEIYNHRLEIYERNSVYRVDPKRRLNLDINKDEYKEESFSAKSHKWKKK